MIETVAGARQCLETLDRQPFEQCHLSTDICPGIGRHKLSRALVKGSAIRDKVKGEVHHPRPDQRCPARLALRASCIPEIGSRDRDSATQGDSSWRTLGHIEETIA